MDLMSCPAVNQQIKLSENGESDVFDIVTLDKDDCDLAGHSMPLSEVILRKAANPDFDLDSKVSE